MASTIQSSIPLYYNNPYLLSHVAKITDIGSSTIKKKLVHWIRLDETIFHPQGGGQPSDSGTIDGHKVDFVFKNKIGDSLTQFEIDHCFDAPVPFQIGQTVQLHVNAEARNLHMRLHTAGHLLGHLVETQYPTLKVLEASHTPHEARINFRGSCPDDEIGFRNKIEPLLRESIQHAMPTNISYEGNGERLLQVADYPAVPCGGTHVGNLQELGEVIVTSVKVSPKGVLLRYEVTATHNEESKTL